VYKDYQKRDGTPEIYAAGVLSLMQFLTLVDLMFLVRLFYNFAIPSKYFFIPLLVLIIGINWFKYERGFDVKNLEAKWGEENSSQRKRRGWLLVVSLISLILFPILIGVLKHNLGVI
jgi:hypothetical protein